MCMGAELQVGRTLWEWGGGCQAVREGTSGKRTRNAGIAIDFLNRQLRRCDAQRLGNLLARGFPHRFFGFLLGIGALRNAEAARNFCLG
ncbi:MAG: hypothetical protein A2061_04630 [Gallionellales bacterium GWA2_59_43]|nr:MAG: hypothetical protein A2061_04630 [Gallionellales bacterium GWA2_59_43]